MKVFIATLKLRNIGQTFFARFFRQTLRDVEHVKLERVLLLEKFIDAEGRKGNYDLDVENKTRIPGLLL